MKNTGIYTGEIVGEAWENYKKYYLVIITKWSSEGSDAKEIANKAFYFSDHAYLHQHIKKKLWLKFIYENYQEATRFTVTYGI